MLGGSSEEEYPGICCRILKQMGEVIIMMYRIENKELRVEVSALGAELQSIYDKKKEREVLWQGDKKYWGRRAPILFPNVGRHSGDFYLWKGKRFDTKQHGFARDMEFICVTESENQIVFSLKDTEKTREYFPFAFELRISYILSGRALQVTWEVDNRDQETMFFTIGGHPAFRVPVLEDTVQTDYKLLFNKQEELKYRLICQGEGTADPSRSYKLPLEKYGEHYGCSIRQDMFDRDALIFDDGQIQWAAIGYPDGTPYVSLECGGFTNFGIWSVPGAPFVCLEPWMGRCDDRDFSGEIREKPGILKVDPAGTFQKFYEIKVY